MFNIHVILAILNAGFAFASAFVAYRAMHEGLTRRRLFAAILILAVFAVGRVTHMLGELLHNEEGEVYEYAAYLLGFMIFMALMAAVRPVKRTAVDAANVEGGKEVRDAK